MFARLHRHVITCVHGVGFGLVSIFNVFLILALGVAKEEGKARLQPMRSAYSGSASAPLT